MNIIKRFDDFIIKNEMKNTKLVAEISNNNQYDKKDYQKRILDSILKNNFNIGLDLTSNTLNKVYYI